MVMPPLVVPRTSGKFSDGSHPACCQACRPAHRSSLAARVNRASSRRVIFVGGMTEGRSTSAATLTRCRLTSNRVTGRKAAFPKRKPSALEAQSRPNPVTMPAPVMTTRGRTEGRFGGGNSGVTVLSHSGRNGCWILPRQESNPWLGAWKVILSGNRQFRANENVTDQPPAGVRPSSGAAISELPRLSDSPHAVQMSYAAAPGDGRTPTGEGHALKRQARTDRQNHGGTES